MQLELVWSPSAGDVRQRYLQMAEGATIEQALRACPEFADQLPGLGAMKIGVWGRLMPLSTALRDRDRIEVYRPLTVDPKESRRLRFRKSPERVASRHRPLGGKIGL
ncbi:RnfH family protein [Paucibacter sp. TC2R-5]|uniref:RnfH family protein n=1 Tax=Paucibacter sp. TC2R-5 TaxID=2893555 RepID=UPI0021E414BE|nr:RnfH family protein [Paucibacter sp. TC2R-5]MCV2357823.1 RnfH family protein [Paucibacter sp. TC2R-5]